MAVLEEHLGVAGDIEGDREHSELGFWKLDMAHHSRSGSAPVRLCCHRKLRCRQGAMLQAIL
jgi:hypothetical protein